MPKSELLGVVGKLCVPTPNKALLSATVLGVVAGRRFELLGGGDKLMAWLGRPELVCGAGAN